MALRVLFQLAGDVLAAALWLLRAAAVVAVLLLPFAFDAFLDWLLPFCL